MRDPASTVNVGASQMQNNTKPLLAGTAASIFVSRTPSQGYSCETKLLSEIICGFDLLSVLWGLGYDFFFTMEDMRPRLKVASRNFR